MSTFEIATEVHKGQLDKDEEIGFIRTWTTGTAYAMQQESPFYYYVHIVYSNFYLELSKIITNFELF